MMKQPVRTNVSDFIKSMMGSQFVIPVYQRNYTWNPDSETKRFLDDIEDLLGAKISSHFLGILIYMESEISAMYKEIQIVDGQQRLTTSFIFLLALKAIAKEERDSNAAGMIDDYYLYNRHTVEQIKLRLKPMVSDDDVYAKLVYGNGKDLSRREKEGNVYRNYEYIYKRIREFSKKYSLLEILNTLGRMDILAFPLSDHDNAQQIFESINSTGAPLTSADLIRNYILMNDTSDIQERNYRLYWKPLEGYCPDSRKLEEFFRYYIAAKTYNLLSKKDVYQGFKEYWNTSRDSKEVRMRDINRYCRYYYEIYTGPAENTALEGVLKEFRRNESRMPAPFLLEMFRMFDDEEISEKDLCAVVRLIDSYLMRRALVGNDSGGLSRYFPQLLRSVMNAHKKNAKRNIMDILKVNLIRYNRGKAYAMPSDELLRSRLREVNAYSLMCIRPVLERIEHDGATAEVDTSSLNIEHIMPQHPNNYWKKAAQAKNDDEYSFYANLIGNLTLCAEYDNTRMGNQDFAFKKKVLSKTLHIRMNTEILKLNEWTPKDILERCDRLAAQIIRLYPYEDASVTVEDEKDDDMIVLTAPTVNARAVYHSPDNIEVLSGTTMKAYGPQEMKSMKSLFTSLMSSGVLSEAEDGRIQFDRNYSFRDLNTAAQFLMHRGGDNTAAWTRENGEALTLRPAEPAPAQPVQQQPAKKKPQPRRRQSQQKKQKSAQQKNPEQKKQEAPAQKKQEQKNKQNPSGNQQPKAKKEKPRTEQERKVEVRVIRADKKEPAEKKEQAKKKSETSGFLKNLFRSKG
ncbi:MAG: DUF262 domain-containing protein [Solobacterium sp.]|nr:DUF262 domain-containing protein [Solobacterium sp.]